MTPAGRFRDQVSEAITAAVEIPPPLRCGSYRAGHDIHYIQARKAAEDATGAVKGSVTEVDQAGIAVATPTGKIKYWNHDLKRAHALLRRYGSRVTVQEPWSVLWIGSHLVSIRCQGTNYFD